MKKQLLLIFVLLVSPFSAKAVKDDCIYTMTPLCILKPPPKGGEVEIDINVKCRGHDTCEPEPCGYDVDQLMSHIAMECQSQSLCADGGCQACLRNPLGDLVHCVAVPKPSKKKSSHKKQKPSNVKRK